jgi:hypothetical protein
MRSGRIFYIKIWPLAVLPFIMLGGCAPEQRLAGPEPPPTHLCAETQDSQTEKLIEIVRQIDRRSLLFQTLTASFDVLLRTNNRSVHLSGQYLGDNHANMRLRLTGLFQVLALDFAVHQDQVSCMLPTRHVAFTGNRREIMDSGATVLALLTQLSSPAELFFPRPWDARAAARQAQTLGEQVAIAVSDGSDPPQPLRRFLLAPNDQAVLWQDLFCGNGQALGHVDYGQFSVCACPGVETPLLAPKQIKLTNAGQNFSLELIIKDLALNQPLDEKEFLMDFPAGQQVGKVGLVQNIDKYLFGN